MGDYYVSVVNIDKREKISIERLGEYQKWWYHFGICENSLVPTMVAWLTAFRNQSGPEEGTSQGRWVGDRVMFCGDGLGIEGDAPGWQIEEVYMDSRRYEDLTPRILVEICRGHSPVVATLAARCLAILRSDPQVDPRMSGDFRGLVIEAIADDGGRVLERELKKAMGGDLDAFLKGPEKV